MMMGNIRENNPEIRRQAFLTKLEKAKQPKLRNLAGRGKNNDNKAVTFYNKIEYFDFENVSRNFKKLNSNSKMQPPSKKQTDKINNCNINRKKYLEDIYEEMAQNKHLVKGHLKCQKDNKITNSNPNCIQVKQITTNKLIKYEENIKKIKALNEKNDKNIIIQTISDHIMKKISNEAKNKNITEDNKNKETHYSTEEFHNFTFKKIEQNFDLHFQNLKIKNSVIEINGIKNENDNTENASDKNQNTASHVMQTDIQLRLEKLENMKDKKTKKKVNAFISFFKMCFS